MRKWFTVPFLIQLTLTIGLTGFFLIQASVNNSRLIINVIEQQIMTQIQVQLSHRLKTAMQLNQVNYDSLQSGTLDLASQTARERYFTNHLKAYPDAAMTFVGLADGSFYGARRTSENRLQVVRNNLSTGGDSQYYWTSHLGEGIAFAEKFPNFDARTRPWYNAASMTGLPVFSKVYSHFIFREPTVTASYPVFNQNQELIGVFGVDYLLSWLGESLRQLPIGASGQIFITDHSGMLIATSSNEPSYQIIDGKSQLISISETNNEIMQKAFYISNQSASVQNPKFSHNSSNYYVGFSHFKEYGLDWNIYVISSEDDFLGDVNDATNKTIAVLVFSLIFSILFTSWLASRVTKPIVTLSNAAEELINGNFVPVDDGGRSDEIGKLTRIFNRTGFELTNIVSQLEEQVSLRTKELNEKNKELRQLSHTDSLTRIGNRRLFDDFLQTSWDSSFQQGKTVALFLLDIDFFKNFNDTYGHQAGDECLRKVGESLSLRARRENELVARYGGEEFAIIFYNADIDKLIPFAEQIRQSVEDLNIEHSNSPFQKITVSIGIAHIIPTLDTDPSYLINMADLALYDAKNNGRNQVSVYHQ